MPQVQSDSGWPADFRARYVPWALAAPLIEKHDYKTYPWPGFAESPWTPISKPLAKSRIAVVTPGGLYRPAMDPPFDGDSPEGDWSFRAIPGDTSNGGQSDTLLGSEPAAKVASRLTSGTVLWSHRRSRRSKLGTAVAPGASLTFKRDQQWKR